MNADFNFKITLPLFNEPIFIKEYTNKWHIDAIKFINDGDKENIGAYFENVLYEHIQNKDVVSKLTIIDKLVALLAIYKYCIDDRITFIVNINDRPNTKFHISIDTIINNIFEYDYKIFEEEEIAPNTFINYAIPSSLYNNPEDIFTDIIYTVFSAPHKYYFHAFNRDEQKLFLDSITISLLKSARGAIENLKQYIPPIPVIKAPENSDFKTITIDLFSNDALHFISTLFNDDIYNMYYKQYHLIKHVNTTYDHFLQMTPMESNAFMKLYENEIKENNLNSK